MSTKAIILLKCDASAPNSTHEIEISNLNKINVLYGSDKKDSYDKSSFDEFVLRPNHDYIFVGESSSFSSPSAGIRGVFFSEN